jgi:hypothetical protein
MRKSTRRRFAGKRRQRPTRSKPLSPIWAIVTGQQVDAYATSRLDEFRQRIQKLKQGGDLANLFRLTS